MSDGQTTENVRRWWAFKDSKVLFEYGFKHKDALKYQGIDKDRLKIATKARSEMLGNYIWFINNFLQLYYLSNIYYKYICIYYSTNRSRQRCEPSKEGPRTMPHSFKDFPK